MAGPHALADQGGQFPLAGRRQRRVAGRAVVLVEQFDDARRKVGGAEGPHGRLDGADALVVQTGHQLERLDVQTRLARVDALAPSALLLPVLHLAVCVQPASISPLPSALR